MFASEPQPTQFDLNFQVFGIPVRVHPLFWLAGIILGARGFGGSDAMVQLMIWVGVLFVSILIHELGHAFLMRYYGASPRIVLYMMGGLAIADSAFGGDFANRTRQPKNSILIAFAGPVAGFLLAAVVLAICYAARYKISFDFLANIIPLVRVDAVNRNLTHLVNALLFVNIFWGLVNLLPVYPLDGGQVSRELFVLKDPWNGMVRSLWLSVFVGAATAVASGILLQDLFIALMFGSLAFSSWQILQSFTGRGGGGYGGGGRPW